MLYEVITGRLRVIASPNPFREELSLFIEKPIPEMKEAIGQLTKPARNNFV